MDNATIKIIVGEASTSTSSGMSKLKGSSSGNELRTVKAESLPSTKSNYTGKLLIYIYCVLSFSPFACRSLRAYYLIHEGVQVIFRLAPSQSLRDPNFVEGITFTIS